MTSNQEPSGKGQTAGNRGHLLTDIGLLSTIIVELNIARKQVALYGARHSLVAESIDRLLSSLGKAHEHEQDLRIGAARKTLLYGGFALDRDNPVFREFAESLFKKRIAAVSLTAGIIADELLQFLAFLAAGGAADRGTSSPEGVFSSPHITLAAIDFSALGFDETREDKEAKHSRPLENYVSALLNGTLTTDQEKSFVMTGRPADIARILNRAAGQPSGRSSYDRIISAYLRGKESDRAARLARFGELIRGLHPDLRRQFAELSLLRTELGERDLFQLLKSLTLDDVEKVLSTVRHGSIPESIRNLLASLQGAGKGKQYFDHVRADKAVISEFDVEIDQNVLELFQNDRFSAFVSDQYHSELKSVMRSPRQISPEAAEEIARECTESFIEKRFASLLLDLVDSPLANDADGKELANAFGAVTEHFLETGRFTDLVALYRTISQRAEADGSGAAREASLERDFHTPEFIEKFVTAVTLWGKHDRTGVEELSRVLAPVLRGPLTDALGEEDDLATRKLLLQLLTDMGPEVLDEAVKRLGDERWYVVRNMIHLIRELKGTQHAERINALSRSSNRRVASEAVRTLLQFNVPAAKPGLKLLLERPDPALFLEAVHLAGAYKVREVVPALLKLLDAKDAAGSAEDRKVKIIKALNEIGDPRALPALGRIAAPPRFFFGGSSERLRTAVYQGLESYPPEAVRPLIEDGLRSGNEEIKAACRAWQRRKERVH
jgi:HEAT repeat protein